MATFTVFPHDHPDPLGPNDIKLTSAGANIDATASGDTFIIDPSMNGAFGIDNGISNTPIDVNIQFDASNTGLTGSRTLSIRPDVNPNFTIADNVDISNFNISAPFSVSSMQSFDLTLGANSSLSQIAVGGSGTSGDTLDISVTLGDGATLGTGGGDAIAAGGSRIDFTFNGGNDATLDGDLALGGSNATYDVDFGTGGTVTGNFSWGGSNNSYIADFGSDFTLEDSFFLGGSSNTQQITFGDNATIDGSFSVGGALNDNAITFGDGATITGPVTGSTSGTETWTFGDDWQFDSSFSLQGGDDTLVLGSTTRDSSGTINGGSGSDLIKFYVPAADQAAFDAAIAAAGWTDNGDGSYTSNGSTLVYKGVQFSGFETAASFVCFASGTLIDTPLGRRPVESLKVGDLVHTLDNGVQPLLWIGCRTLRFPESSENQKPIRFKAGSLSEGLPRRDLVVSPQHRMLIEGPEVQHTCGQTQALALAKGLLGLPGVRKMNGCRKVTYHTLLFERHQVIMAEGALVESFYPGPYAMKVIGRSLRNEVLNRLPALCADPKGGYGPHAKPVITRAEAMRVAEIAKSKIKRHLQRLKADSGMGQYRLTSV